jgi:hypothetical protein
MSLPRTSKELNSCPSFFLALPQNLDKNINYFPIPYSINLADLINVNKEFLPKFSPKKLLSKNSSQKMSPKKIPPKELIPKKNPPKKFPKKFQRSPKNFQKISQKIPKILKISNSLDRT